MQEIIRRPFSLNFEPASHRFSEAGENQPDQNRRDESKLRPLLVRVDAITLIALPQQSLFLALQLATN